MAPRRLIGIDLGTSCGWTKGIMVGDDWAMLSGIFDLSVRHGESKGMRFLRFEKSLKELIGPEADLPKECRPVIVYEDVRFFRGAAASSVYMGLRAILQRVCAELELEYLPIPVGTLKKTATGKGNASKDEVVAAAKLRWPDWRPENPKHEDDEADSRWLVVTAGTLI